MQVTPKMKLFIKELHQKYGVKQSAESLLSAVCEYFTQTEEGSDQVIIEATSSSRNTEKLLSALGVNQELGTIQNQYSISQNGEEVLFQNDDVVFFSGVLLQGRPYPQKSLFIEPALEDPCEMCGALVPCGKMSQTGPGTQDFQVYCNHCRLYSEITDIRQSADHDVCRGCTKIACAHNPRNTNNIKLLPAAVAARG